MIEAGIAPAERLNHIYNGEVLNKAGKKASTEAGSKHCEGAQALSKRNVCEDGEWAKVRVAIEPTTPKHIAADPNDGSAEGKRAETRFANAPGTPEHKCSKAAKSHSVLKKWADMEPSEDESDSGDDWSQKVEQAKRRYSKFIVGDAEDAEAHSICNELVRLMGGDKAYEHA